MTKKVLDFLCTLEGYKTALKSIHWNATNMSQHKLCDDIADKLATFQDVVAEVEQSLHGNLPFNKLKGTEYKIKDLKKFLSDLTKDTTTFYKKINGDDYIGLRSECETFIKDCQQFSYLNDFTIKNKNSKLIEITEEQIQEMVIETINILMENKKRG